MYEIAFSVNRKVHLPFHYFTLHFISRGTDFHIILFSTLLIKSSVLYYVALHLKGRCWFVNVMKQLHCIPRGDTGPLLMKESECIAGRCSTLCLKI